MLKHHLGPYSFSYYFWNLQSPFQRSPLILRVLIFALLTFNYCLACLLPLFPTWDGGSVHSLKDLIFHQLHSGQSKTKDSKQNWVKLNFTSYNLSDSTQVS